MWLHRVERALGDGALQVEWRPFSLEQANSKEGPGWKVWEQPDDYPSRGLLALRAGEAARRQGPEAFRRFLLALFSARHERRRDLTDRAVVLDVAHEAGLDGARFQRDLADPALKEAIARSHTEAVERFGVFGVPTFVFPSGASAFLKMLQPPEEDAVGTFRALVEVMGKRLYIGEVKRPQPPWPRGVYTAAQA